MKVRLIKGATIGKQTYPATFVFDPVPVGLEGRIKDMIRMKEAEEITEEVKPTPQKRRGRPPKGGYNTWGS